MHPNTKRASRKRIHKALEALEAIANDALNPTHYEVKKEDLKALTRKERALLEEALTAERALRSAANHLEWFLTELEETDIYE